MKVQITANNLGKAISRAYARRGRVRRAEPNLYVVTCSEAHEHLVTVEEDGRGQMLTAECKMRDGSDCPSARSRKGCYHIPIALALHVGLKSMLNRADARGEVESVTAHVRASQTSVPAAHREPWRSSVKVTFVGGRKVERVRGFQI